MRASECAGYPSQLAAVRAMALAGIGRVEIRQRTGLDSHTVGSLLAKVRAEARGDAPAWDAAREASARRIYRAGVLVMAEHFGVTVAEFLLHATGVPGAGGKDGVSGPEGSIDGDVGAAEPDGAGEGQGDRGAGGGSAALGVAGADAAEHRSVAAPPPPASPSEPLPRDAGEDQAAAAAEVAAAGAAGEPGGGAGAEAGAAAEAALLVDVGKLGAEPEVRLSAPPQQAPPPALADTELDGEVHLRSWDGQRLHVNQRVLTRLPRFYWRGTRADAEALRRKLPPAWGALSLVPAGGVL